jgi:hypothetical protein
MYTFYCFRVQTKNGEKESPSVGAGDIMRLKELFPKNPIWKSCKNDGGNIYLPDLKQARALYKAMVEYRSKNNISRKQYVAGNATGSFGTFSVTSNLRCVFNDFIEFFEKTIE